MAESNHFGAQPIWARPEPAARQPRFSRQQIAGTALAIADADGFEAVTMRRIARGLGAGTMSLYRYIATRDDLLALMGDALLGDALVGGELPADWREALAAVARQTRESYLRHPWAVGLLGDANAVRAAMGGPNGLRHVEQSLGALAGAPMDSQAKLDVLAIVDDYVFGHLLRAVRVRQPAGGGSRAGEGGPADADRPAGPAAGAAAAGDFLSAQLESGELPRLASMAGSQELASAADPACQQARFELGLAMLLDGIAARFG